MLRVRVIHRAIAFRDMNAFQAALVDAGLTHPHPVYEPFHTFYGLIERGKLAALETVAGVMQVEVLEEV